MRNSLTHVLRGYGYYLTKLPAPAQISIAAPYIERPEYGASNIETKLQNVADGLPFEYPEILNLNSAVVSMVGEAKAICELGCGTGNFATGAADADKRRIILASEYDRATYEWAKTNKFRDNITYIYGPVSPSDGPFDLVVAIELIEHLNNYRGFLETCCNLAPRALITTPNRARGPEYHHSGPPPYYKHVREWTAGEFFWIMRTFYSQVDLYAFPCDKEAIYTKVDVDTHLSPLIADCKNPH